jgi:signal transduction histidine kinase/ActR/RegA family two-component response regulator
MSTPHILSSPAHSARRAVLLASGLLAALVAATVAAAALAPQSSFLPHAVCLTSDPALLTLHGVSNVLIAAAYFSIPLGVVLYMRRRPDLPMRWLFGLFGLFIVACGFTHLMGLITLWWPAYWLDGGLKALTAAVSLPTAMALWHVMPRALQIPSTEELRSRQAQLAAEISERKRAEQALRRAQAELEQRVAERTQQLDQAKRALEHANAVLDTLIECAPVGLGLWDLDLRYQRLNSALAQMNGPSAQAHLGRRIDEVLPHMDPRVRQAMEQVVATGCAQRNLEVSGETPAAPGKRRYWRASYYPVTVGEERVGVGAVCEEITEAREGADERERLLEAERAARAEAERANRLKDDLLASVSHELRTPLSAIMSGAFLLQAPALPAAQARNAVEIIARNARAQARLIDDLLDVARIVAGQLKLELAPVSLHALVERTLQTLQSQAEAHKVKLVAALPPEPLQVAGDADRLAQVLGNLVGNAIKFSPPGGRVDVRAGAEGAHVQLSVRDEGEGIDPSFLPQLFEPFRQGSGDLRQRRAGLGLGLSIARRLAEMHGGTVRADSAGPGRGATFTVHLPLRQGDAPPGERHASPASLADLTDVHVLMVDDEDDLLQVQAGALRTSGARVSVADGGATALRMLETEAIDVLVSDLGMPGMDGFVLMQRWRARERELGRSPVPAIALSGYARVQDAVRAREAGFSQHLAKPVDSTALALAIKRIRAVDGST